MSLGTLGDPALRQAILQHMLAAIAATPVLDDPFPHIIVRGFFPESVYQRLLEYLPDTTQYTQHSYKRHLAKNGETNRLRFGLENASLATLSREQQVFWHTVRCALGSVPLKEGIFNHLQKGLAYRYGCDPAEAKSLPGFAQPELIRETAGYTIAPHPDTRKKVVTMQIALPRDDSQIHLGTEYYRRSFNPMAWLREPRGFEIVKTTPFLPNTAAAFVVLNTFGLKSWHGRTALNSTSGIRNSILSIWYDNVANASQDIAAANEAGESLRQVA
jgi:hypothetical protein